MTLGKGFLGVLFCWGLSLLLVVGLHETGKDSPSEVQPEKVKVKSHLGLSIKLTKCRLTNQ